MKFEPIKLRDEVFESEDPDRPFVLAIDGRPSEHWIAFFEELSWFQVPVYSETSPKVISAGIAVPSRGGGEAFQRIWEAINRANEQEAQRVAGQGPDLPTRYHTWFAANFPPSGTD